MAKKNKEPFTTRLEPGARKSYGALSEKHGISIAALLETLVYWLEGDVQALSTSPEAARNLIAEASGRAPLQGDGDMEEIKTRLLAIERLLKPDG